MFKLYYTKQFKKDARKLNDATRDKLDKALDLLAENPRHPFLDTHKNHRWGAWQSDIDQKFRMVWDYGPGQKVITLFAVGDHKIIE